MARYDRVVGVFEVVVLLPYVVVVVLVTVYPFWLA